jgi:hypothetical protein
MLFFRFFVYAFSFFSSLLRLFKSVFLFIAFMLLKQKTHQQKQKKQNQTQVKLPVKLQPSADDAMNWDQWLAEPVQPMVEEEDHDIEADTAVHDEPMVKEEDHDIEAADTAVHEEPMVEEEDPGGAACTSDPYSASDYQH